MWLEYLWTIVVLAFLEGLLSADNALVLAILVKHLPPEQRLRALTYGLVGAYVFRFLAILFATVLIQIWQFQALGAAYLLYVALRHLLERRAEGPDRPAPAGSGFWGTVVKVELADIAFAIDSILAAVALVQSLPPSSWPPIGGLDGGRFAVVILGGFIGVAAMRLVAGFFIGLLQRFPGLERAAYLIVGWIGIKLAVVALSHPKLAVLPHGLPEETWYKLIFWGVLLALFFGGLLVRPARPLAAVVEEKPLKEQTSSGDSHGS
ncbi:MAG: TerC family protein [Bacteroidota bacterium]|nr:TerC family protein [Bacteroidota bacterium]